MSLPCFGKLAYSSRRHALERLRAMARNRSTGGRLHSYHCEYCGYWHIGHRLKAKDRVA